MKIILLLILTCFSILQCCDKKSLKPADCGKIKLLPAFIENDHIDSLKKDLFKRDFSSKKYEIFVKHSCTIIDTSLIIIIYASGNLLVCQKYSEHIKCYLPKYFFKKSKNYQIGLYDLKKEIAYIWSADGGDNISVDAHKIYFTLYSNCSDIREFKITYK